MRPRGTARPVRALLLPALLLLAAGGCGGGDATDGAAPDTAAGGATDTVGAALDAADAVEPGLTELRIGGHAVRVEIADDPEERRRGLMHRDSLPEDRGMLFVYPDERILSFWMRNTRIPLDIAYVDQRGHIVDIQTMSPQSDRLYESSDPAMYAIEMGAGWFEEHGVSEGDRVEF